MTAIGNTSTATQITTASPAVGVNWIGNVINIASGTGFTVQWVQVNSVSAGVATVDKTLGGTSLSGGAGTLGGALDGLGTLSGVIVASNKAFMLYGSYSQSATTTFSVGLTPLQTTPLTVLTGYYQVRGDITPTANLNYRPTITLATNTGLTGISITGYAWTISNIIINCAGLGTSTGILFSQTYQRIYNCKVTSFTSFGIKIGASSSSVVSCEVTRGTAAATAAINSVSISSIANCYVHDNACPGIVIASTGMGFVLSNLVTNNTGASSDGINTGWPSYVMGNTSYGNGRHGIYLSAANLNINNLVKDNLLVSNVGYGLIFANAGYAADFGVDGNAYYPNTNTRSNIDDKGAVNAQDGVSAYLNPLDVILTATPFVKASLTLSDLSVDASNNLIVTSSTYSFVSGDVGATLYIQNTTGGWTAGKEFTIVSVAGGAATLNACPGATSSTGGVWHFDNYQLNTTAGGGAACTGYGVPTSWPGNTSTVSYPSMGAVQPQNTGGGGPAYFAF